MSSHLVISAIAPNRPGIANEIISLVSYCRCNIVESKMKSMGNTFSLVLMAEGEWNALAKLEHILPQKAPSMGMTTLMQRTESAKPKSELPYRVKVITLDNPGITSELISFFAARDINIQEMSSNTYPAQHSGVIAGQIKLTISIPTTQAIANVRDSFNDFCAKTNLDGIMEPITQ